jgi:hypothetical protein
MIKRIFHPIGQGAFYSERHYSGESVIFTIVYDCGNSDFELTSTVVTEAFEKDETINILFISHFDWYHISKIRALRDHTKIERVVMPLLHENKRILLTHIYEAMGEKESAILVSNPKEFFEKKTEITYVRSAGKDDQYDNNEPISVEKLSEEINSGTKISVSPKSDWIYIPYNRDYKKKHDKLIEVFKKNLNPKDLVNNTTYTLGNISEIIEKVSKNKKETKKKGGEEDKEEINVLKKAYITLSKNINNDSMIVYSGPSSSNDSYVLDKCTNSCSSNCEKIQFKSEKVACLYTGDAKLYKIKKYNLKEIFKKQWDNIGTIQIPHHGSLISFNNNKDIFHDKNYCCPISFGKNNSHKHPSDKVIKEIEANNCCPIKVTEEKESEFIQTIMPAKPLLTKLKADKLCRLIELDDKC